jgi:uncharacterized Zn-binding protein involved in type VI secretion
MTTGTVPHVGGPISQGSSNVLTGSRPQARVSDMLVCIGPADIIAMGSAGVFVNNLPAARLSDKTAHGGAIVAGLLTVLIGGGSTGVIQKWVQVAKFLADGFVQSGGSGDANDAKLVAAELTKLPAAKLKAMQDAGIKVVACRGAITDYATKLKGVQPRGWPPGSTWDHVPGVYMGEDKTLIVATTGHGTAAGAHVPATGEGHGSYNAVLHEAMHGSDDISDAKSNSSSADFTKAYQSDYANLGKYYQQAGAAGRQETYAESAAQYYGNDPNMATKYPALYKYWDGQPHGP